MERGIERGIQRDRKRERYRVGERNEGKKEIKTVMIYAGVSSYFWKPPRNCTTRQ